GLELLVRAPQRAQRVGQRVLARRRAVGLRLLLREIAHQEQRPRPGRAGATNGTDDDVGHAGLAVLPPEQRGYAALGIEGNAGRARLERLFELGMEMRDRRAENFFRRIAVEAVGAGAPLEDAAL